MASGGAKNIGLIVIAVAAIGGAAYLLSQSMGSGGTVNKDDLKYFMVAGSEQADPPQAVEMTIAQYNSHIRNKKPIEINGSTDVQEAGKCPNGRYYPLGGHGAMPEFCSCGESLAGYNRHGEKVGDG